MESWIVVATATLAVILAGVVIHRGIKKKVVPPPGIHIAFDQYKDRERMRR